MGKRACDFKVTNVARFVAAATKGGMKVGKMVLRLNEGEVVLFPAAEAGEDKPANDGSEWDDAR